MAGRDAPVSGAHAPQVSERGREGEGSSDGGVRWRMKD